MLKVIMLSVVAPVKYSSSLRPIPHRQRRRKTNYNVDTKSPSSAMEMTKRWMSLLRRSTTTKSGFKLV